MKAGRVKATSQVSVVFSSVNSRYARAGARATRSSRENVVEGFTRFGTAHVNTGAARLSRRASLRNEKPQLCSRPLDRFSRWIGKCKVVLGESYG